MWYYVRPRPSNPVLFRADVPGEGLPRQVRGVLSWATLGQQRDFLGKDLDVAFVDPPL